MPSNSHITDREFRFVAVIVTLAALVSVIFCTPFWPHGRLLGGISCLASTVLFWQRYNIARWMIMISSVFVLLNALSHLLHPTVFKAVGDAIMAPLAVFLLYWLSTSRAKKIF